MSPHDHATPFDFARDAVGHGCFAVDLDGQVQSFVHSVRDALIECGELYQDGDHVWRLRRHGLDLRQQTTWMACCDFCGERPVCWNIECETFVLPQVVVEGAEAPEAHSIGDWAACETCGTFIVEGRRRQLLARSQAVYGGTRLGRKDQERLQRLFWRHYTGGATRVQPRAFGH